MKASTISKFTKIIGVFILLLVLLSPQAALAGYTFSFGYSSPWFPNSIYTGYSYGSYGSSYGSLGYSSFYYPRLIPTGPQFYRTVSMPQLSYTTLQNLDRHTTRLVEAKKSEYLAVKARELDHQQKILSDEPVNIHIKDNIEKEDATDSNSTGLNFTPKETIVSDDKTVVMNSY